MTTEFPASAIIMKLAACMEATRIRTIVDRKGIESRGVSLANGDLGGLQPRCADHSLQPRVLKWLVLPAVFEAGLTAGNDPGQGERPASESLSLTETEKTGGQVELHNSVLELISPFLPCCNTRRHLAHQFITTCLFPSSIWLRESENRRTYEAWTVSQHSLVHTTSVFGSSRCHPTLGSPTRRQGRSRTYSCGFFDHDDFRSQSATVGTQVSLLLWSGPLPVFWHSRPESRRRRPPDPTSCPRIPAARTISLTLRPQLHVPVTIGGCRRVTPALCTTPVAACCALTSEDACLTVHFRCTSAASTGSGPGWWIPACGKVRLQVSSCCCLAH